MFQMHAYVDDVLVANTHHISPPPERSSENAPLLLKSRGGSGREQLYHHRRDINLAKCFIVDAPSYGDRCFSFLGELGRACTPI